MLCLAGWVEYPYSQTNYAAATAGVALKPPAIERRRDDGSWEVIEPHAGYPAGLPRLMTLDLTGKLGGPRCVLRIKTNMECYYDQAFVAVRDRAPRRRSASRRLPVARAVLGYRGYTREVSPDGEQPSDLRLRLRRSRAAGAVLGQADAVRRRGAAARKR